jgi:hypothetical protein
MMRTFNLARRKPIVHIGNETVEVAPASLDCILNVFVLIAPYLPFLEQYYPEFMDALNNRGKTGPKLLSSAIKILFDQMRDAPGLTVKILSLLIDRDVEWVARNITPKQFIEAFVVLDRVNNFMGLVELIKAIGVEIKYVSVDTSGGINGSRPD